MPWHPWWPRRADRDARPVAIGTARRQSGGNRGALGRASRHSARAAPGAAAKNRGHGHRSRRMPAASLPGPGHPFAPRFGRFRRGPFPGAHSRPGCEKIPGYCPLSGRGLPAHPRAPDRSRAAAARAPHRATTPDPTQSAVSPKGKARPPKPCPGNRVQAPRPTSRGPRTAAEPGWHRSGHGRPLGGRARGAPEYFKVKKFALRAVFARLAPIRPERRRTL